jgi:glycosyltransferase involved in cell wall biosynthesis
VLSIIIPCHNAERTLRATVDSALAQDVEKEIIVVDDGSTDGTADIIRSFGTDIRSSFGPNKGVGAARNTGTSVARGDFLQYLDSDDLLVARTLRLRLSALETSGSDVAHTDWQQLIEQPDGSLRSGPIMRPPVDSITADAEVATATSRFWAPPAALLYRRAIVEAVGRWREDFRIIQDARFLFDAAACGARFAYVSGIGALYRVRRNSLSRHSNANFIEECSRNAAEIERRWSSQQPPTTLRRETIYAMWRQLAVATATGGLDDFEAARAAHNRLGPRNYSIESVWLLRACFGKRCTAAMSRLTVWCRGLIRQLLSMPMGEAK